MYNITLREKALQVTHSKILYICLSVLFVFRSFILLMHVCMLCIDCILSQHCTLCQFMRIKSITCLIYFSACHFQQVLWPEQHYLPTRCVQSFVSAFFPFLITILNLNLFFDSVHCHLAPLFFFFLLLFLVFIIGGGGLHHLHFKKSYNSCLYDNFSCLSTFIAFVNFCAHDLNLYNAYFYHVTYLKKKNEEKILEMFIYQRKF